MEKQVIIDIKSLTGLRFYAALLVFVSHLYLFDYFIGLSNGPASDFMREIGWVGVSLFFTLSGFVLYINYPCFTDHKFIHTITFYVKRLARIYPAFLVVTLTAAIVDWFFPDNREFWMSLLLNMGMLHCLNANACSAFSQVGWSLSHEFIFYLCFPLFSLLFVKNTCRRVGLFLVSYFIYLTLFRFLWPDSFYADDTFALNRFGEFLLGMLGGYLYLENKGIKCSLWGVKSLIAIALLVMILRPLIIDLSPAINKFSYLLYTIPTFAVISGIALLERREGASPLLTHPFIMRSGEISYSFYLVHHLLMRCILHVNKVTFNIQLNSVGLIPGLFTALLLFIASWGCACFLYRYVEIPGRQWILKRWYNLVANSRWWWDSFRQRFSQNTV